MAKALSTTDLGENLPPVPAEPVLTGVGGGGRDPINVNVTNDPVNVAITNTPTTPLNVSIPSNINVTLNNMNPLVNPTPQILDSVAVGQVIQNRSEIFGFNAYRGLMDNIFRGNPLSLEFNRTATNRTNYLTQQEQTAITNRPLVTINGAYDLLKAATERYVTRVFDTANANVPFTPLNNANPTSNSYLNLIINAINQFFNVNNPQAASFTRRVPVLIELIWSYWHEAGMLSETMDVLSKRFKNMSNARNGQKDPLTNLATDPLRPLNNILWGYIQDSIHRLTPERRAYEYENEYGLSVFGGMNMKPADRRTDFVSAFHDLLHKCSLLFKESDDRTRTPDGFPILNALQTLHLTLAEGAHNQFGDLPLTARVEMFIEQWILSQPEIREFLGGKIMVPYRELWMDRVDTMKNLQGWTAPSVTFYNDLARFGEQLLLHIRYTSWVEIHDPVYAATWALDRRAIIQNYVHAYRVVTNIDMSADAPEFHKTKYNLQPSDLIMQKFEQERRVLKYSR